jgi:hypothetical protein
MAMATRGAREDVAGGADDLKAICEFMGNIRGDVERLKELRPRSCNQVVEASMKTAVLNLSCGVILSN